jgi:hypothetical protein
MMSSRRFGGKVTSARPRVEIGPALRAEAGAVVPTEQQVGLCREGKFLPNHRSDVHRGGPLRQRVEIRIVGGVGIGGENRRVYFDVHFIDHFGETAPALAANHAVEVAAPEILPVPGCLELAVHRHRTDQIEPQPFEGRILGGELAHRPDRASLKVPDIHSQHSPLT